MSEMTVRLRRLDKFKFEVDYGDVAGTKLLMDEPSPIGDDQGPSAGRVLASAVANCLMASLGFCMSKRGADDVPMEAEATVTVDRNEKNRLRIVGIKVKIHVDKKEEHAVAFEKCSRVFEEFCIVTSSVKEGIQVETEIVTP
jgi:uncharacterized OsmC-like protein